MKKFFFLFIITACVFVGCGASTPREEGENVVQTSVNAEAETVTPAELVVPVDSQYPIIYVSVFTHAEQADGKVTPDFVADQDAFWEQRQLVVDFAQMLNEKGVSYNYQSDWNFLLAALNYDQGTEETLGKNFLQYLHEDLGVEIDPHNHAGQSKYNAADVAYLIHALGVEPSGVVGGFIALPVGDSNMQDFWQPMHGAVYDYTWTPTILWGGGTFNHQGDQESLLTSGIWRPQNAENFFSHDGNAPLPVIGRYASTWQGVDDLLKKQEMGVLEKGKIYTVSVDAHQKLLSPQFITRFARFIDAHQTHIVQRRLQWATLTTVADIWEDEYDAEPNQLPYVDLN